MREIILGSKKLVTDRPAFVMGIVNVTPDSFFDKSRGGVERALQLIEQGADILDIGGESTRPGYTPVPADEEIKRILPVIKEIRSKSDIAISVDTTKLEVFKAAYEAGADIWNDVSSLSDKVEAAEYQGGGSVYDVKNYLEDRAEWCLSHGVKAEKIIIDPGIGFGKTNEECIEIIKHAEKLCQSKYPLLMALSRKRCIGGMTDRPTEERLVGTVAADMISVQKGAIMVRVHDVAETIDSLNVMKYLQ